MLIECYDSDAANGYRLYNVPDKSDIPFANQSATPRTLECFTSDATMTDCLATTAVPAGPREMFYQIVGVCGGNLEGPVE